MSRPIIGITLDCEAGGGYSPLPWYALRKEYFSVIVKYGAIPMAIPHEISCIDDYLSIISGLILTGGDFDIPPEIYGSSFNHTQNIIKHERTAFEYELARKALEHNKPTLGICAGEQLLNVILGGTLIQHIPDEIKNPIEHRQSTPRTQPWHDISITPGSILHSIVKTNVLKVNSNHHQAVKTVGDDVVIGAVAPDGVIEAIEYTKNDFCIGVEWHPELETSEGDGKIFRHFINACR